MYKPLLLISYHQNKLSKEQRRAFMKRDTAVSIFRPWKKKYASQMENELIGVDTVTIEHVPNNFRAQMEIAQFHHEPAPYELSELRTSCPRTSLSSSTIPDVFYISTLLRYRTQDHWKAEILSLLHDHGAGAFNKSIISDFQSFYSNLISKSTDTLEQGVFNSLLENKKITCFVPWGWEGCVKFNVVSPLDDEERTEMPEPYKIEMPKSYKEDYDEIREDALECIYETLKAYHIGIASEAMLRDWEQGKLNRFDVEVTFDMLAMKGRIESFAHKGPLTRIKQTPFFSDNEIEICVRFCNAINSIEKTKVHPELLEIMETLSFLIKKGTLK